MARVIIVQDSGCNENHCAECGRLLTAQPGPRLVREADGAPFCRECARWRAPSLVALLDLAKTAQRVARAHRPTLVPPLNALLDLARAAEDYTYSLRESRRQAA
jgi:hypothetical protein